MKTASYCIYEFTFGRTAQYKGNISVLDQVNPRNALPTGELRFPGCVLKARVTSV